MKLGLHAFSLLLAGGLREYQPVGHGTLTAAQLLEKAAQLKFTSVQLARNNIIDWDMVALVNLRQLAEELQLTIHLSTNRLQGEHLADMIRFAYTLGACQVTVGLAQLTGNVQQRQQRLESLLTDLDVAIKTAERYKITLAIENGHHTAAIDLTALVKAAQSERLGVCYDMGNALTVPESPVEAAEQLAPYCKSIHLKDMQVFRTVEGVMLVNCPVGNGVVEITEVMRVLKSQQPDAPVFMQTAAERIAVPIFQDEFLVQYPRITARALAGLIRRGAQTYEPKEQAFPHEGKATEKSILKWEEDRLKQSIKQSQTLFGTQTLKLSLDE